MQLLENAGPPLIVFLLSSIPATVLHVFFEIKLTYKLKND